VTKILQHAQRSNDYEHDEVTWRRRSVWRWRGAGGYSSSGGDETDLRPSEASVLVGYFGLELTLVSPDSTRDW
jgi:hypothetical protein